ncbi:MAG: hypothetical protein ACLP75_00220 [Mycobacterium sp.]|uniref:hypothetical protein n=1 Tax=Mycobacterium sp. TaxID=1785 RepID=UPI003F969A54
MARASTDQDAAPGTAPPLEDALGVVEHGRLWTYPVGAFDQPGHVRATLVGIQTD